ncbi:unnamed protein product [Sphagnum jensenii]|uniref:Uncharacterized protein n=1 Tax=Sphagnum jensenii TaxID=128206 RepID=A0ABP0X5I0_9BRYO
MGISNVQHVSKAAAERLTAKFGDLCDPHELMKHQSRRMRISQLASKSRQATKTIRQMRLREKAFDEVKFSSTDEEAFVMSLIPLRAEPALIKLRRSQSLKMPRAAGPGASVKSYSTTGVTKKLLKMCRSSSTTKYISLPLV